MRAVVKDPSRPSLINVPRRMFEMAKDEIVESQTYEIMAGYYSPV